MEIILKRRFKYKIKDLKPQKEGWPRLAVDIYCREGLDLWYTRMHRIVGDSEEELSMKAKRFIKNYSHVIWLTDYLKDRWFDFKWFLSELNPVKWDSKPCTLWKKYSKYFKKLPVKFSFTRHEKICNLYPTEYYLKWYNPVVLYVSDVYWKTKFHEQIFIEPPQIRLILFRRWSLTWSWTVGMLDSLYWETMLNFGTGQIKSEDLNKYYLSIHPTGEELHLDSYLNLEECGITNTFKIYK